ncbi:hypothetical protein BH23GEM9_BH23GEM9_20440 [soil metagenome]
MNRRQPHFPRTRIRASGRIARGSLLLLAALAAAFVAAFADATPLRAQAGSPGATVPTYTWAKSDPVAIQVGNRWVPPDGADSYSEDRYERPFSTATSNNVYYAASDISSYSAGVDGTWLYYSLQMVGGPLTHVYGYELNFRGGTRAQRGDMLIQVDVPSSNLPSNGPWGKNGVKVFIDNASPGVGGASPLTSDDGKSGSGYSTELSNGDSIWARVSGSTLEIAVRRSWLTRINGNQAPASASFRGWAAKGNAMDRAKMMAHDHRTRSEANSPYPFIAVARPPGVPAGCPNSFDSGITEARRAWLEQGTATNTGVANPCYPSSGIYESDNTGSVAELALQNDLSFLTNLNITQTAAPSPGSVGQTLTYTLTVQNPASGSGPATGVIVRDTLPGGVTFSSAQSSEGSCTQAGVAVTCTIGAMAAGTSVTISIAVVPTQTGTIANIASVSSTETDQNAADNRAVLSTVIAAASAPPNLLLLKSATPAGPALPGAELTYTISFQNSGASDALTVVITDELPGQVQFGLNSAATTLPPGITGVLEYYDGSVWSAQTPGTCGAPAGFSACVQRVRLSLQQPLQPSAQGSLSFGVRIR